MDAVKPLVVVPSAVVIYLCHPWMLDHPYDRAPVDWKVATLTQRQAGQSGRGASFALFIAWLRPNCLDMGFADATMQDGRRNLGGMVGRRREQILRG